MTFPLYLNSEYEEQKTIGEHKAGSETAGSGSVKCDNANRKGYVIDVCYLPT